MKISEIFDKSYAHIILIALLGLLAYSNTFDVPFQFDDEDYIVQNPLLKEPGYFINPSADDEIPVEENVESARNTRRVGFLSFWLNYRFNGLEVGGYHIFNLAVHILNAILLYLLIGITSRTPLMKNALALNPSPDGRGAGGEGKYIALFSSLLFVSHPVQTQAVTYISQRFASLVALFYIGSLVFYVKWRLAVEIASPSARKEPPSPPFSKRRIVGLFYPLSLLFSVLAMYTKENAFTLPVSLLLYEAVFFGAPSRRRILGLIPFALTMLIIPLNVLGPGGLDEATRAGTEMPRLDYLFTQFRVIATYMRLLILPINQNLDYDYPIYRSFIEPAVFISFLFLLAIFGVGTFLLLRSGNFGGRRLIGFGILWFFLTLSVESSIIPAKDVIFEHRLYLPSVGAFMAITAAMAIGLNKAKRYKLAVFTAATVIIAILSAATYARNRVWASEIALWEDVVRKAPRKARGYVNLAKAYKDGGMPDKAIERLLTALRLDPEYDVYFDLGVYYEEKGMHGAAIAYYQEALRIKPDYLKARYNLARAYYDKGQINLARMELKTALEINPKFQQATQFFNHIALMNILQPTE